MLLLANLFIFLAFIVLHIFIYLNISTAFSQKMLFCDFFNMNHFEFKMIFVIFLYLCLPSGDDSSTTTHACCESLLTCGFHGFGKWSWAAHVSSLHRHTVTHRTCLGSSQEGLGCVEPTREKTTWSPATIFTTHLHHIHTECNYSYWWWVGSAMHHLNGNGFVYYPKCKEYPNVLLFAFFWQGHVDRHGHRLH